jgi:hypothetical protein
MPTHEEAHQELAALESRIHRAMGQEGAIGEFNRKARAHAHLDHTTHYPTYYRPLDAIRRTNMTEVIIKGTTKRTPKAAKPKAQPHPCECGCGEQTITGRARFIPGHDARLKSQLIAAVLDGSPAEARKAEARLVKLGWAGPEAKVDHLAKSRAAREAKAAKAKSKAKAEPQAPAA